MLVKTVLSVVYAGFAAITTAIPLPVAVSREAKLPLVKDSFGASPVVDEVVSHEAKLPLVKDSFTSPVVEGVVT